MDICINIQDVNIWCDRYFQIWLMILVLCVGNGMLRLRTHVLVGIGERWGIRSKTELLDESVDIRVKIEDMLEMLMFFNCSVRCLSTLQKFVFNYSEICNKSARMF